MRFDPSSAGSSWDGRSAGSLLVAAAVVATLIFLPLSYEYPVTLPKLIGFSLCVVSAVLLLARQIGTQSAEHSRPWRALVGTVTVAFVAAITVRALIQQPVLYGLMGVTGRNNGAISYALLGGLACLVLAAPAPPSPRKVLAALSATGAITTLYFVAQMFGLDPIPWNSNQGVSTLGNVDHVASWHAMVWVASMALCFDGTLSRTSRYAAGVVAVASVFVVTALAIKIGVIQGVLLGVIGLVMLMWPSVRAHLSMAPNQVKATLVVVGIFLAVTLLGGLSESRGVVHRAYLWIAAGRMFVDHPWIGVGVEGFGNFYQQYRLDGEVTTFGSSNFADDPHGVFAQIVATGGLLVGIPYLGLLIAIGYVLVATYRTGDRLRSPAHALAAVTAMAFVQAQFSPETLGMSSWAWLGIGVLACQLDSNPAQRLGAPLLAVWMMRLTVRRATSLRVLRVTSLIALVLIVGVLAHQVRAETGLYRFSNWMAETQSFIPAVRNALMLPRMRDEGNTVLAARPGDQPTAKLLVRTFVARDDFKGALQVAANLLTYNPHSVGMMVMAGDVTSLLIKNPKLASQIASELTAAVPRHPGFWSYRAAVAARDSNFVDALRSYHTADSLGKILNDPDSAVYQEFKREARAFLGIVPSP